MQEEIEGGREEMRVDYLLIIAVMAVSGCLEDETQWETQLGNMTVVKEDLGLRIVVPPCPTPSEFVLKCDQKFGYKLCRLWTPPPPCNSSGVLLQSNALYKIKEPSTYSYDSLWRRVDNEN